MPRKKTAKPEVTPPPAAERVCGVFDYSSDALTEIDAFFRRSGTSIIALTVKDILEEQIARKLA
jgi:hypothetical protein